MQAKKSKIKIRLNNNIYRCEVPVELDKSLLKDILKFQCEIFDNLATASYKVR